MIPMIHGVLASDRVGVRRLGAVKAGPAAKAKGWARADCGESWRVISSAAPRVNARQRDQAMDIELPTLIVIDMQKGMAASAAGPRNNPDAERNIERLLAAWRKAGSAVVHVRHVSRSIGSPFWPGQAGAEFQDALAPLPTEHVVEKNVPDAFVNSALERWLRVRSITRLAIVGVSTNNSVEATARTAGCLGFDVQVVSDAAFAFAKVDYSGVRRTADEVHAMSLANLEGEYATITNTRRLLDAVAGP
jgi:nicotinamidase-related amidase